MATISRLSVDLVANSAQFRKDLDKASKSADKSFGKMMKSAKAATAAFVGIGAAAGKIFVESARTYGNFTEALQDVSAKTGATKKQLDQLSVSMRNAAKATRFTATETAQAGTFLAQAGLNVREINDALRPTLDLAAATKTSVQNTADFMTNIMKGMGMSSNELERAADVLAVTTAKSNTNLTDLATAMSYAAPSARAMGMEIEETSTLIGMMANAGIKGSMAGTALRGAFSSLATTGGLTEKAIADSTGAMTQQAKTLRRLGVHTKDAEGNVRGLTDILNDLKDAGGNEQDMIAIFGRRAGSAMMQFMNEGLMGADALKEKLDNARKAAEKMAATQMDSLNGDLLLFNSQLEELQMVVAENGINDLFRGITQSATKFMKNAEPAMASIAKYADEIAVGLAALTGVIVLGGLAKLTTGIFLLTKAMLLNPVFLIAAGFTALAVLAYKNIEEITFYWKRFTKNMGIFADNLVGSLTAAWNNIGTNFDIMIVGFKLGLESFKKAYLEAWNFVLAKMQPAVKKIVEMYNAIPFMDDVAVPKLNLDTTTLTSKIQTLKAEMDALVASKETFTQAALDNTAFVPTEKSEDGGLGIEDIEAGTNGDMSKADQHALDLLAHQNREKNHWETLLGFQNDYTKRTTDMQAGSWQDIIAAGAKGSRKLLMIQQAMSIKSIMMATATGIAKALEMGFPTGLIYGAKVAMTGATQLAAVRGQFHQGIDSVPDTGNYTLLKGERVMDQRLNKDMTSFLANQNSGNASVTNNPTLNFNVTGGDADNVEAMLMNHRGKFEALMRDVYNESAMNSPF